MADLWVPVYLPGHTAIGRALVDTNTGHATISIEAEPMLMELIEQDLIGLQVMFLDRARAEEVMTNKEKKDEPRSTD